MSGQLLDPELAALLERSLTSDFHVTDRQQFETVNDTQIQVRRRQKPAYRKIDKYFKSPKQYQKERHRRRQVRHLHDDGFTYPQIADKLGISSKTVYRDMKKQRPYLVRRFNDMLFQFHREQQRELEQRMAGMTDLQQLHFLTDQLVLQRELFNIREYHKHTLNLTINVTELLSKREYGRPIITVSPKHLNCSWKEFRIQFWFLINGVKYPYGVLEMSS